MWPPGDPDLSTVVGGPGGRPGKSLWLALSRAGFAEGEGGFQEACMMAQA
jgi:hypothetical protein